MKWQKNEAACNAKAKRQTKSQLNFEILDAFTCSLLSLSHLGRQAGIEPERYPASRRLSIQRAPVLSQGRSLGRSESLGRSFVRVAFRFTGKAVRGRYCSVKDFGTVLSKSPTGLQSVPVRQSCTVPPAARPVLDPTAIQLIISTHRRIRTRSEYNIVASADQINQ